jgi:hypothetical protein
VELPVAVAGLGEKLAVTFDGRPEIASVTELLAPTAVRLIVTVPLDFRLTVRLDADIEMAKSPTGGLTFSVKAVVWVNTPSVPLIVRL